MNELRESTRAYEVANETREIFGDHGTRHGVRDDADVPSPTTWAELF
jgi:hypothetical protein